MLAAEWWRYQAFNPVASQTRWKPAPAMNMDTSGWKRGAIADLLIKPDTMYWKGMNAAPTVTASVASCRSYSFIYNALRFSEGLVECLPEFRPKRLPGSNN